jgi:alcohol dehydrogenase class IV
MINGFSFANTPQLYFGNGKISTLPAICKVFGSKILLITGARSFKSAAYSSILLEQLDANGFTVELYTISKEPTPIMIDRAANKYAPDVVVAIGGGSVLDAGKAISAMLPLKDFVKHYLEGIGTQTHPGTKIPFVAIPTTSGTGSEATKNAVLSETGEHGYKKSLRHNNFVPNVAILDPSLTLNCPKPTTAASGMDAFTQLLESYLSTASNPMTDALALEGLKRISDSLLKSYHHGSDLNARTDMAMAAYLSGITLANAGLGLVHGFASSIGGYYEIPHGVICSSMMASTNKITVRKLRSEKSNNEALEKYATAGRLFSELQNKSSEYYTDSLLDLIDAWANEMKIPKLSEGGVTLNDVEKIVENTDNKNNPVKLNKDEVEEILKMAM